MPVGTILPYVGSLADIPKGWHLCDGTDGTPNLLDNRFLEGDATPGIFREPGLPNSTGQFGSFLANGDWAKGAFKSYRRYESASPMGSSGSIWYGETFDLENGRKYWHQQTYGTAPTDTIFGNSTTVQPKSYTVYYIMKMK